MMEREPDVAALAARLGLRRLAYRSFPRPVLAPPVVVARPDAAVAPAQDAAPPAVLAAMPQPVIAAAPDLRPAAFPVAARAVPDPAPHFPLLAQALARVDAAADAGPAAALPFLNLRRALAGPSDTAEH